MSDIRPNEPVLEIHQVYDTQLANPTVMITPLSPESIGVSNFGSTEALLVSPPVSPLPPPATEAQLFLGYGVKGALWNYFCMACLIFSITFFTVVTVNGIGFMKMKNAFPEILRADVSGFCDKNMKYSVIVKIPACSYVKFSLTDVHVKVRIPEVSQSEDMFSINVADMNLNSNEDMILSFSSSFTGNIDYPLGAVFTLSQDNKLIAEMIGSFRMSTDEFIFPIRNFAYTDSVLQDYRRMDESDEGLKVLGIEFKKDDFDNFVVVSEVKHPQDWAPEYLHMDLPKLRFAMKLDSVAGIPDEQLPAHKGLGTAFIDKYLIQAGKDRIVNNEVSMNKTEKEAIFKVFELMRDGEKFTVSSRGLGSKVTVLNEEDEEEECECFMQDWLSRSDLVYNYIPLPPDPVVDIYDRPVFTFDLREIDEDEHGYPRLRSKFFVNRKFVNRYMKVLEEMRIKGKLPALEFDNFIEFAVQETSLSIVEMEIQTVDDDEASEENPDTTLQDDMSYTVLMSFKDIPSIVKAVWRMGRNTFFPEDEEFKEIKDMESIILQAEPSKSFLSQLMSHAAVLVPLSDPGNFDFRDTPEKVIPEPKVLPPFPEPEYRIKAIVESDTPDYARLSATVDFPPNPVVPSEYFLLKWKDLKIDAFVEMDQDEGNRKHEISSFKLKAGSTRISILPLSSSELVHNGSVEFTVTSSHKDKQLHCIRKVFRDIFKKRVFTHLWVGMRMAGKMVYSDSVFPPYFYEKQGIETIIDPRDYVKIAIGGFSNEEFKFFANLPEDGFLTFKKKDFVAHVDITLPELFLNLHSTGLDNLSDSKELVSISLPSFNYDFSTSSYGMGNIKVKGEESPEQIVELSVAILNFENCVAMISDEHESCLILDSLENENNQVNYFSRLVNVIGSVFPYKTGTVVELAESELETLLLTPDDAKLSLDVSSPNETELKVNFEFNLPDSCLDEVQVSDHTPLYSIQWHDLDFSLSFGKDQFLHCKVDAGVAALRIDPKYGTHDTPPNSFSKKFKFECIFGFPEESPRYTLHDAADYLYLLYNDGDVDDVPDVRYKSSVDNELYCEKTFKLKSLMKIWRLIYTRYDKNRDKNIKHDFTTDLTLSTVDGAPKTIQFPCLFPDICSDKDVLEFAEDVKFLDIKVQLNKFHAGFDAISDLVARTLVKLNISRFPQNIKFLLNVDPIMADMNVNGINVGSFYLEKLTFDKSRPIYYKDVEILENSSVNTFQLSLFTPKNFKEIKELFHTVRIDDKFSLIWDSKIPTAVNEHLFLTFDVDSSKRHNLLSRVFSVAFREYNLISGEETEKVEPASPDLVYARDNEVRLKYPMFIDFPERVTAYLPDIVRIEYYFENTLMAEIDSGAQVLHSGKNTWQMLVTALKQDHEQFNHFISKFALNKRFDMYLVYVLSEDLKFRFNFNFLEGEIDSGFLDASSDANVAGLQNMATHLFQRMLFNKDGQTFGVAWDTLKGLVNNPRETYRKLVDFAPLLFPELDLTFDASFNNEQNFQINVLYTEFNLLVKNPDIINHYYLRTMYPSPPTVELPVSLSGISPQCDLDMNQRDCSLKHPLSKVPANSKLGPHEMVRMPIHLTDLDETLRFAEELVEKDGICIDVTNNSKFALAIPGDDGIFDVEIDLEIRNIPENRLHSLSCRSEWPEIPSTVVFHDLQDSSFQFEAINDFELQFEYDGHFDFYSVQSEARVDYGRRIVSGKSVLRYSSACKSIFLNETLILKFADLIDFVGVEFDSEVSVVFLELSSERICSLYKANGIEFDLNTDLPVLLTSKMIDDYRQVLTDDKYFINSSFMVSFDARVFYNHEADSDAFLNGFALVFQGKRGKLSGDFGVGEDTNSVAVGFSFAENSVTIYQNGSVLGKKIKGSFPSDMAYKDITHFDFYYQKLLVEEDGKLRLQPRLNVFVRSLSTKARFLTVFDIDIASAIGSKEAYIGFSFRRNYKHTYFGLSVHNLKYELMRPVFAETRLFFVDYSPLLSHTDFDILLQLKNGKSVLSVLPHISVYLVNQKGDSFENVSIEEHDLEYGLVAVTFTEIPAGRYRVCFRLVDEWIHFHNNHVYVKNYW